MSTSKVRYCKERNSGQDQVLAKRQGDEPTAGMDKVRTAYVPGIFPAMQEIKALVQAPPAGPVASTAAAASFVGTKKKVSISSISRFRILEKSKQSRDSLT